MSTSACLRVHVYECMSTSACIRVHVYECMSTSACLRVRASSRAASFHHRTLMGGGRSWAPDDCNQRGRPRVRSPGGAGWGAVFLSLPVSSRAWPPFVCTARTQLCALVNDVSDVCHPIHWRAETKDEINVPIALSASDVQSGSLFLVLFSEQTSHVIS